MQVGIAGCGTIGSEIAVAISNNTINGMTLMGICDTDENRTRQLLSRLRMPAPVLGLDALIDASKLIFEASTKAALPMIATKTIEAGKDLLAMSVGGFVDRMDLFELADRMGVRLFLPTGAVGGMDSILAAKEAGLQRVRLTTTKNPKSFQNTPYVLKNNIAVDDLKNPKIIFEGTARQANLEFPKSFNVAITLSLAGIGLDKTTVRIVADPGCHKTRHEIIAEGAFGTLRTMTESNPAPDNPHTSYLAILSAMAALRRISSRVRIGT